LRACLSECLLDAIEFAHKLLDVYRHSGYRPHPSQPLQLAAQRGHTWGAHTCAGRFRDMGRVLRESIEQIVYNRLAGLIS